MRGDDGRPSRGIVLLAVDNDGNYTQQPAKNTQASQRGDHTGWAT